MTRTIGATAKRLATAFDRRGLDPDTVTFLNARLKSVTDRLTANTAAPILPLLAPRRQRRDTAEPRAAARPRRRAQRTTRLRQTWRPSGRSSRSRRRNRSRRRTTSPPRASRSRRRSTRRSTGRRSSTASLPASATPPASSKASRPCPVELTPELDLPAWQFLRDNASEWLLPGSGTIDADSVIGLETNPGVRRRVPARAQRTARRRAALPQLPADPGLGAGADVLGPRERRERRDRARHRRDRDLAARHAVRLPGAPDAVGLERRPRRPLQHAAVPRVPGHARLPGAGEAQRQRHAQLVGPARLRRAAVPRVPGPDLLRADLLRLRP